MDAREIAEIVKALERINAPEKRLLDRIFSLALDRDDAEEATDASKKEKKNCVKA